MIARSAVAMREIRSFFVISFMNGKKRRSVKNPKKAEGKRTAKFVSPKIATETTVLYI